MPTVRIDDHPYWLIRLNPEGPEIHPEAEVPDELYKRHIAAMEYLNVVQKELRAIYNRVYAEMQAEQLRRQKSEPVPVGPPTETDRKSDA